MTFFLAAMGLRVLWVWGQVLRRQGRVVRAEPFPASMEPIVKVGRRDPKHMTTGQIEQWLKEIEERRAAIETLLWRTEAKTNRWDKGN